MDVAIFDLDRTLTRYSTYTPFLIFAAFHRAPLRLLLLPVWVVAMLGYVLGAFSRKRLKEIGFFLMIGGRTRTTELDRLADRFAARTIARNLMPAALERVRAEHAQGAFLMLATASPSLYADRIGAELGFDLVVATRQQAARPGQISHRIDGDNCYGAEKLRMIEAACAADPRLSDVGEYRFYSDSASDAPTLAWAGGAYAVNPDRALRRLAARNGWSVLDFA